MAPPSLALRMGVDRIPPSVASTEVTHQTRENLENTHKLQRVQVSGPLPHQVHFPPAPTSQLTIPLHPSNIPLQTACVIPCAQSHPVKAKSSIPASSHPLGNISLSVLLHC